MNTTLFQSNHERWAQLRFAIVGPLLAAPPAAGELHQVLKALSDKSWTHPISGLAVRFSYATIERWYYAARQGADPIAALRPKRRHDAGQPRRLPPALSAALHTQYRDHPGWSYQLHYDNLAVVVQQTPELGALPSYATLRRAMKAQGWSKQRRRRARYPGEAAAEHRQSAREVRSFEAEYVHALWHLDFHQSSRSVVLPDGRWVRPWMLGIVDDYSRLACHVQWYLHESAQTLVHGLSQAIQKRALPRALLTDNGGAMLAEEVQQGLERLSIVHETTLPYSPYQNGKQEVFWASVEGRLLAMLDGVTELTLQRLNEATQAWVELEYQRKVHSELGGAPLKRALDGRSVGRPSPDSEALRRAFRQQVQRTQRRSDGTLTVLGRRFELPARYRALERVTVRYARWDLSRVDLIDPDTAQFVCALYPLDKTANAEGRRRCVEAPEVSAPSGNGEIAPLLQQLIAEYAATGLPPAYVPPPLESSDES
jgi:transposase InsO family protein